MKRLFHFQTIFLIQLALFVLVVLGIVPRSVMLYFTVVLAALMIRWPLKEGILFFVQSVPLFVALPLTDSFDNFNAWRIILLILFGKWVLEAKILASLRQTFRNPKEFWKTQPYSVELLMLLIVAVASLIAAQQIGTGIKRIIYFVNISFLGFIIYDLVRRDRSFVKEIISAIRIPTMIVIAVGFIQVISTYLIDIYQFMRLWGEGIQCNQFGTEWCTIAVELGNTWFAYYGEQLSLRVFSLFPDSHSFPQFVLLGIPALLTYGISNITSVPERLQRFKTLALTRGRLAIVWVPAALLVAILSGTRGIWAASVGVVIIAAVIMCLLTYFRASTAHKTLFRYCASYLVFFFLLFSVAYPIFTSPQFLLSKGNLGLFGNRIRSIIDFGETSNSQRIEIWKKSLTSIADKPLLGVGIGNFPVVLGQDIFLARAGSSAHNIYLHIAAEMGILALLLVAILLGRLSLDAYRAYTRERDPFIMTYLAAIMLFIPWVLIYSLTDVALFDERALLFFVVPLSILGGLRYSHDE